MAKLNKKHKIKVYDLLKLLMNISIWVLLYWCQENITMSLSTEITVAF